MPERAKNLSEVFNANNSFESGWKAISSFGGALLDGGVAWANIPSNHEIWWLKPLVILAIMSPLGLAGLYQAARTSIQGQNETLRREREMELNADTISVEFQRFLSQS